SFADAFDRSKGGRLGIRKRFGGIRSRPFFKGFRHRRPCRLRVHIAIDGNHPVLRDHQTSIKSLKIRGRKFLDAFFGAERVKAVTISTKQGLPHCPTGRLEQLIPLPSDRGQLELSLTSEFGFRKGGLEKNVSYQREAERKITAENLRGDPETIVPTEGV